MNDKSLFTIILIFIVPILYLGNNYVENMIIEKNAKFSILPSASASCDVNKDWLDEPCYDAGSITLEEKKRDWEPYYDYKGKDWMDAKRKELIVAVLTNTTKDWIDQTSDYSHWNVYTYYSLFDDLESYKNSPLKQFKIGIQISEIRCKEGLDMILKVSNGFPICVTPETEEQLIERGWAKPV